MQKLRGRILSRQEDKSKLGTRQSLACVFQPDDIASDLEIQC